MSERKESSAMQLLSLVWNRRQEASASPSWGRLNHGMQKALELAIGFGMNFAPSDFCRIYKWPGEGGFNGSYWMSPSSEWVYSLAIRCCNRSAILAYEAWKKRKPIIADNVSLCPNHYADDARGYMHGSSLHRQRERLAVGFRIPWRGEEVYITRIGAYAYGCSYETTKRGYRGKIIHKFIIGPEEIKIERRRVGLIAALRAAANKSRAAANRISKALGNPTTDRALMATPLAVVEAAAVRSTSLR